MKTGNLIRELREGAGLTQKQLGDLCGMADSAIRRYESGRGNPTEKTLQRIAGALKVPVESLLSKASETQHYEELDDMYYKGVIKWSEDGFFSEDESAAIKKHLAELLLRYKKTLEALVSYKISNPQFFSEKKHFPSKDGWHITSKELLKYQITQEIEAELSNLKTCIDSFPHYFSDGAFKKDNAAPGAANTEGGKEDTDH